MSINVVEVSEGVLCIQAAYGSTHSELDMTENLKWKDPCKRWSIWNTTNRNQSLSIWKSPNCWKLAVVSCLKYIFAHRWPLSDEKFWDTNSLCDFSLPFLLPSYTGHIGGHTFQQFTKRLCFFELVFQNKNLTGETSHKYFPKYFVMDLRKDPVYNHPIRSKTFCLVD